MGFGQDRERIAKIEANEPTEYQKNKSTVLRSLLLTHGGKMLAKDARKMMGLERNRFSELLAASKDDIEVRPYHLNKSWKVLILR